MYEQEIKSYCRQAQKYLACEKKQRDRFDRLIADSANEFLNIFFSDKSVETSIGNI